MIEGLKLRVTAQELREHCQKRVAHHNLRAEEKTRELPALRESLERLKKTSSQLPTSVSNFSKGGGYRVEGSEVVEQLEADIRDHRYKALFFAFLEHHLFDEDYTLKEEDLVRLEILRK